jgi:hypothetical protein
MMFAAVHESGHGTKRTSRAGLAMSVDSGRPEVERGRPTDANDPSQTWAGCTLGRLPASFPGSGFTDRMRCLGQRAE